MSLSVSSRGGGVARIGRLLERGRWCRLGPCAEGEPCGRLGPREGWGLLVGVLGLAE
ncbi:MAG: hypothetical protein V4449_01735 [Patescibacteria group bacterium]